MNIYAQSLIENADKLDSLTDKEYCISDLSRRIIELNDDSACVDLYKKLMDIVDLKQLHITKQAKLTKECLFSYEGYLRTRDLYGIYSDERNGREESLQEILDDLNELVGLDNVKQKIQDLISYQKVIKLREQAGLFSEKNTLHLAFIGNPGTGKTTVARIIGRLYRQIGLLSRGHYIEASRTDLIAGYQGQTALKVKSIIERAKGGVLFIDEAYSITENDHSDSYGRECLTELTKALEDYRNDLVVIVAGYTIPMEKFFESNPGLKSRFNIFIEFEDYDSNELECMFELICKKNNYVLSEESKSRVHQLIKDSVANKEENFSNGRLVRNLFENTVMNHARRLDRLDSLEKSQLVTIELIDLPDKING